MLETLLVALFVLQQSYWTTQTLAACLIFFKESRVVAFASHKTTVKLKTSLKLKQNCAKRVWNWVLSHLVMAMHCHM